METITNIAEIIGICICIALIIGIATVIFASWWLHEMEKNCSPTDRQEERDCAQWEHWRQAEK